VKNYLVLNNAMDKKLNASSPIDRKKTSALAWNDAQKVIKYNSIALINTNVINLGKTLFPGCFGCFCVKFVIFYVFLCLNMMQYKKGY
jgi:hypothetical protein